MVKNSKQGPEYSQEREWRVILEDLRSQFRAFGEGLDIVQRRLGNLEDDVAYLKNEIMEVKIEMVEVKRDMVEVKRDMVEVKRDMVEVKRDMVEVKSWMAFMMDKALPTIATKDDLLRFATKDDLRVFARKDDLFALESRVRTLEASN